MRPDDIPAPDEGTVPAPARPAVRGQPRRVVLALPYLLLAVTLVPITVSGSLDGVGPFLGLMGLVGLVLTVMAARRTEGRAARPWWLLSLSWLLLALTSAGFTATGFAQGHATDPASGLFVTSMVVRAAFGVVLFTGLVSFGRNLHGLARWRLLTDAVTLSGAGLMVMWYFLLGPALSDHQSIGMARAITIFLPISDLPLVLGTVVVLLSGSGLTSRRALLLLLGGVMSYLLLDSLLVAQTLYGSHFGIPLRLELLAFAMPSFLFAAAAAEHCRTPVGHGPDDGAVTLPPVTWLPQVGLVIGFALLATVAALSGLYPWPGLIAGAIIMTFGIAVRQSLAVRENRDLALTDVLTRLPNRARFTEMLTGTLDASYRTGVPAAVLLIDLDEFKPINDRYGHAAGDEVLVAFATILRRSLRREDHCARLGGDEFAVIVHEVPAAGDAEEIARRLLAALAATPVLVGGHRLYLRASLGIAVTDPGEPAVDGATMLRRADDAMYAAKRSRTDDWQLWSARTAGEAPAGAAVQAPAILYQPIHDLAGRLVAVHVIPGLLPPDPDGGPGWARPAATELDRWRTASPAHRDLRLLVTARPDGPTSLDTLGGLGRSGIRPTDLIVDIGPLALADDAALAAVQGLRAGGVLTAVDATDPQLDRTADVPGLPVDLVLAGSRIVGGDAGGAGTLPLVEAAMRIGQALRSGPHAQQPGPAEAIEALILGERRARTGPPRPRSPRRAQQTTT